MQSMTQNNQTLFEKKIKPVLQYIGTIGAALMVIAYICIVLVMIFGFKVKSLEQSITFAIVNGAVGFVIMQFLKVQGIDFAKSLPHNQEILTEYYNSKDPRIKKHHSITFYWIKSIVMDVLSKVLTIAGTTCCLIYIIVEGSSDYSLLLLAVVNLIMFVCFGLLSLVSSYDFYNNEHIPYLSSILTVENQCKTNEISNENEQVNKIYYPEILVENINE